MAQNTTTSPSIASTLNSHAPEDVASHAGSVNSPASSVLATPEYKLVIEENVVEKIASLSAQKIDGIIDMKGNLFSTIQEGLGGNDKTKGVNADVVNEQGARVNLDIILEYGKSAPEIFERIKDVIGGDLECMTGLRLVEMTVNVVDVMSQEEYNTRRGANTDAGTE